MTTNAVTGRRSPRANGREIARQVLRRVRRDEAWASLALAAACAAHPELPAAERGLATELVYGVLRHRRLLDHALQRHARRPLGRLDADVLDVLRLGAYQLLLLERIPAYAAVNWSVGEIRRLRGPALGGVANAVLRGLGRADLEADLPDNAVARLGLRCSLPDALAEYWVRQLGLAEAEQLGSALLERAPLSLRVNTLRVPRTELQREIEGEGARVHFGHLSPQALFVENWPAPFSARSYAEGRWTVQDEAAQLVGLLLDPRPGERVLDACAGLGGKSTHLATLMGDRGEVVCADISARKLQLLEEHCQRLGIRSCVARHGDLRAEATLAELVVDRVLLDAPCTGLGVLRRHPELKWREGQGLAALPRLVELQRELLAAVLRVLRPGGVLVYSVCTMTEEEGPAQIAWLRSHFPELQPLSVPASFPQALASTEGVVRLWPHRHSTDGFFMARLVRGAAGACAMVQPHRGEM